MKILSGDKIRVGIISHIDQSERRLVLPDEERKAGMLRKLYRWSKIEYDGALWEEFRFFKHITAQDGISFNVWEMPVYSGLHVQSVIEGAGAGIMTCLVNTITDENRDAEFRRLREFAPECLFLSATFVLTLDQLTKLACITRELFPDVPLVLGGHFVAKEISRGFDPVRLLQICGDNVYLIGSKTGEEEILKVIRGLRRDPDSGRVSLGPMERIVFAAGNNEKYPIDRWAVNFGALGYHNALAPIKASVGCPFSCNFCSYPESGGVYLQADLETTLKQLRDLSAANVKMLIFTDDTLNVPPERFNHLLREMLREGLTGFQCFSFCRCQFLTEETVALMKLCGFAAVLLGIESGSAAVLEHMNKKARPEQYLKGIDLLKKHNITTFGAIMIGHPGETDETVRETVEFLNVSGLDYCYIQPFYYLHNSPIYRKAADYGLTGEGLRWNHRTMNSAHCLNLLDKLIFEVRGPVYANEEYAMWELIYFLYKGYNQELYRNYRLLLANLRRIDLGGLTGDRNILIAEFCQKNGFLGRGKTH